MSEPRVRLTAHEEVELYIKSTGKDVEYLFVLAYQAYFSGRIDIHEIKHGLYSYDKTQDPPPYVRAFLQRRIN